MKAAGFSYERPETLEAALALLAHPERDVRPLAGGQSLLPMMNFRVAAPDVVLDLGGIPKLAGVSEDDGEVTIGAMTRFSALAASEVISRRLPLLAEALPHIAHPAIRNRGTIGGSLALADPAAELPAVALALEAQIVVVGRNGRREVAAKDFFHGIYETALATDELIAAIRFPAPPPASRSAFAELSRRHGDYAVSGVAVAVQGVETVKAARIALFAVSSRAIRATAAEEALLGQDLRDPKVRESAAAALDDIAFEGDLHTSAGTKRQLAQVLIRRTLARL